MPRYLLPILLAALSLSASAAPVLSTIGYVAYWKARVPQYFCDLSGGASTVCSGSGALSGLPELNLSFDTEATAGPGVLKARASGSITGVGIETVNSLVVVRANALFRDRITFLGLQAGTPGSVTFSYALSGSIWGSDLEYLNPGLPFQDSNGAGWSVVGRRATKGGGNVIVEASGSEPPSHVNLTLPVVFGQPEDLVFMLVALLNLRQISDGSNATADFGSTATLIGMSAYDLDGRLVPDFYATGSGDSSYLDVGPAIPEPATWASAACGLLFLAWRCRSRRPC